MVNAAELAVAPPSSAFEAAVVLDPSVTADALLKLLLVGPPTPASDSELPPLLAAATAVLLLFEAPGAVVLPA